MRDFKFRAWIPEINAMIPWKYLNLELEDGYGGAKDNSIHDVLKDIEDQVTSNFELMQYIGLKDKNGVEIFEGDLVDMDDKVHGINGYRQIEFKDGAFGIRPMNKNDEELWWASVWNMNCVVIGNIYSNPELVGATQ